MVLYEIFDGNSGNSLWFGTKQEAMKEWEFMDRGHFDGNAWLSKYVSADSLSPKELVLAILNQSGWSVKTTNLASIRAAFSFMPILRLLKYGECYTCGAEIADLRESGTQEYWEMFYPDKKGGAESFMSPVTVKSGFIIGVLRYSCPLDGDCKVQFLESVIDYERGES